MRREGEASAGPAPLSARLLALREILEGPAPEEDLSALFGAVASRERLAVIEELARVPATINHLADRVGQEPMVARFHTRVLRRTGVATMRTPYIIVSPERFRALASYFDRAWRVASVTAADPIEP